MHSGKPPRGDDTPETSSFTESGYRSVFLAAPDGILIVDRSGVIRDVNPAAEKMFGYEAEEMRGRKVELLVPAAVRSRHEAYRERYTEDPHPRPMGIGLELQGTRKDGISFPVEISLSPLIEEGRTHVIAAVRDMSRHRRLRRFGVGTLRAAEEERRKLARELHDDTAQQLATSLLRIRTAQQTENAEERVAILDDLRAEILRTAESVRRIARGLRPPALQDVGVVAAIRAHVRSLADATEMQMEVANDVPAHLLDEDLEDDMRLVVYRVIQEALSNAVRHSNASRVVVRLGVADVADVADVDDVPEVPEAKGRRLVVEIEDDGGGFHPERVDSVEGAGLGLIGMQERVAIVGGAFELDSRPGEGTRIRMELPLDRGTDG